MNRPSAHMSELLKRALLGVTALVFAVFMPMPYAFAASADSASAPAASASCSPVATPSAGIDRPTGAAAATYTYNSCTGLWENEHYTWNPATKAYTPKTPDIYACDTASWQWVTKEWLYSPAAGAYTQVPMRMPTLPAGAQTVPGSPAVCAPAAPASAAPQSGATATDPADTETGLHDTNADLSSASTATIANHLGSTALSGAAVVVGNTGAGDAASGNATAAANLVNSVNSASTLDGGTVMTFTANINGDVQGDLLVDPSQLQPASGSSALDPSSNFTVHAQDNGTISNDVHLNAATGDATVAGNTQAGSATTGNAAAIANVVNELNSIVSAGKSFIGTVNINGNLNGNVLVPQSFLDSLVATNTPSTTMEVPAAEAANLGIDTASNQAISNTVDSSATTGNASVDGNTQAGNATTGNGSTKVTIFNLTGRQIVGSNCLLVFVNVAGRWVGVIMNAPAGATAAALGSGITNNAIDDAAVHTATNDAIDNTNAVAARSGDARVADNTQAGNAASGNADTAVNLLNLENSQLSLSGWFGVLFINVFGNWFGNFGVYTPPAPATSGQGPEPAHSAGGPAAAPRVFRFAPPQPKTTAAGDDTPLPKVGAELASKAGQILGAARSSTPQIPVKPVTPGSDRPLQAIGGILVATGLSTLALERLAAARRSRREAGIL